MRGDGAAKLHVVGAVDEIAARCGTASCDDGAVAECDIPSLRHDVDGTVLAAGLRTGVQRAGNFDVAVVSHEVNAAVALDDALCTDDTGLIDHRTGQRSSVGRGEIDAGTIGEDLALIGDGGRRHGRGVQRIADQLVAGEIERHLIGSGQEDGAEPGANDAGSAIGDGIAEQRHIATIDGVDHAFVDHAGAGNTRRARKPMHPGHEVCVGDVHGRRHQAGDVNAGGRAEKDAVGVDQKHLAVGREVAEDAAGRASCHPVQHDGTAVRLHELDRIAGADREAVPIDHGAGSGHADGLQGRAGLGNRCRALGHRPAAGHLRMRRRGPGQRQGCYQCGSKGSQTIAAAVPADAWRTHVALEQGSVRKCRHRLSPKSGVILGADAHHGQNVGIKRCLILSGAPPPVGLTAVARRT